MDFDGLCENLFSGVFFEEFLAWDEFDFNCQKRLCPSLLYKPKYRASASIESFLQFPDVGSLFEELIKFSGLYRIYYAGWFFEDRLVGVGLFEV